MIGQVDMEKVFNEYRDTKDLQAEIGKINEDLKKAQQEGDGQKLSELQQDFQVRQSQLVEKFHSEIEKASASVSERMDLNIVVAEILYTTDKAEVVDVSDELIKEMN